MKVFAEPPQWRQMPKGGNLNAMNLCHFLVTTKA